jgi:predicted GNAT superfamily acetyltransferase
MRDALNSGLPSDRFQVDWWLKTGRVEQRMSQLAIPTVDVDHFRSSGAIIIKAASGREAVPFPPMKLPTLSGPLLLVEIPADFPSLKSSFMTIARDWRMVTRDLFEQAFKAGYHVSNFIHEKGRSYYVLSVQTI